MLRNQLVHFFANKLCANFICLFDYNKMDLILAIAIFGAIVATFDVYWVLRLLLCGLISLFRQTKSVTDVSCHVSSIIIHTQGRH